MDKYARWIQPEERLDDLQINDYHILQDPKRFCFGVDAVLLAHFAKVRKGDRVLDLGTGTGILPILMHAITNEEQFLMKEAKSKAGTLTKPEMESKVSLEHSAVNKKSYAQEFIGLEIQKASVDMANRSVQLNDIASQVRIVEGDIKEAAQLFGAASFQVITTNPPYMSNHQALKNEYEPKTIARHEVLCNLEDVIRESSKLLKPMGRFYMIHKPTRLAEIMDVMRQYRIEPKHMRLVHPYVDKEPTMVMMEGVRLGKPELRVDPPLILYQDKGVYTDEVYEIYGMERPEKYK